MLKKYNNFNFIKIKMIEGYNSIPQNPKQVQYTSTPNHDKSDNDEQTVSGKYSQPSSYEQQVYINQSHQLNLVPSLILGGIKYVYSVDPMKELTNSTGVLKRQEAQFMEQFIGCE